MLVNRIKQIMLKIYEFTLGIQKGTTIKFLLETIKFLLEISKQNKIFSKLYYLV